jgi:hypothetical protein
MGYNTTFDNSSNKWIVVDSRNNKVISEFVDMEKAVEYSNYLNSDKIKGNDPTYVINDGFYNHESFTINGLEIEPGKYVLKE